MVATGGGGSMVATGAGVRTTRGGVLMTSETVAVWFVGRHRNGLLSAVTASLNLRV